MKGLHRLDSQSVPGMAELGKLLSSIVNELFALRSEFDAHKQMTHVAPTGGWQQAKGVLDLGDEKPEDIVRRMRDGAPAVCKWTQEDYNEWNTECENTFRLPDTGDRPGEDGGYTYCPNCGGRIEVSDA